MCGISCCVTFDHSPRARCDGLKINGHVGPAPLLEDELDASLDNIKHRGPDSRGAWISSDKRVALGHVRLSINDLSPDGAQPFHDTSNQVHAVVNGELYDHDRIKAELTRDTGFQFRSRSDCEIVIALYLRYGVSFLSHLRGEFSICLYDERNQLFVAARDRYGIKPLFWTQLDGRLLIAAEAKAFIPFGWQPEWDVRSIKEGGWNFDSRTLFQGVKKVRPGCYLMCNPGGTMEQKRYWDMEYPDKRVQDIRTEEEMIEGVRSRLLESIRLRLRADVPVGIYLSGGIDSSVVAGMVTHLTRERGEQIGSEKETERVSCFSIAFDEDSGFDESSVANRTAEHLGVKFYKKLMTEAEMAKYFEDATYSCEHQNADLNYIGKYALSQLPREHGYKVVLTGEGADETYAGYPMYLADYLREPDLAWPHTALAEDDRSRRCIKVDEEIKQYYKEVGADASQHDASLPRMVLNNITTPGSMTAFSPTALMADWTSCYGACDPQLTIANNVPVNTLTNIQNKWHPLHSAMYIWSRGHLSNIFLSCLGDRTEMAHSIEARTPFLDHELTDYVNNLPPSVKIRWDPKRQRFIEKWILREAAKPFITKELYERKKHPYSAPTTYPVGGPIHKLICDLITKDNVDQLGFIDTKKALTLIEDAFEKQRPQAMRLAFIVAQWIVLAKRFNIGTARPWNQALEPLTSSERLA